MTHGSLFSGIGGFDLGFERVGIKTLWQVECDPYCLKVLEKHWPDVKRYTDIRTFLEERPERTDIISGGFPCQPVSLAGKRQSTSDARWLWPEMCEAIAIQKPAWVVAENVPGLLSMGHEQVCADLEDKGYNVGTLVLPACAIGLPHRRDRLWIIAHSQGVRMEQGRVAGSRTQTEFSMPPSMVSSKDWREIAHQFCRMDDGISYRAHRGKALGNAIVPQIAEEIGRMIVTMEALRDGNELRKVKPDD